MTHAACRRICLIWISCRKAKVRKNEKKSPSRTYGTVSMKSGKSSSDARASLLCESGKNPCINRMAPRTKDRTDERKIQSFFSFIIFFPGRCPLKLSSPAKFISNISQRNVQLFVQTFGCCLLFLL